MAPQCGARAGAGLSHVALRVMKQLMLWLSGTERCTAGLWHELGVLTVLLVPSGCPASTHQLLLALERNHQSPHGAGGDHFQTFRPALKLCWR